MARSLAVLNNECRGSLRRNKITVIFFSCKCTGERGKEGPAAELSPLMLGLLHFHVACAVPTLQEARATVDLVGAVFVRL